MLILSAMFSIKKNTITINTYWELYISDMSQTSGDVAKERLRKLWNTQKHFVLLFLFMMIYTSPQLGIRLVYKY